VVVQVTQNQGSVGVEHEDFELLGITWPDTTLESYRLSDYRGDVVFLAYFATY